MNPSPARTVAPFPISEPHPYVAGLVARLAAGESAQDLLHEVVHRPTAKRLPCPYSEIGDLILYLADHGAHVATGAQDCALSEILDSRLGANTGLYKKLIHGLLGRPHELVLHIFTQKVSLDMSDRPGYLTDDGQRSLRARDEHGRTLSHWLWNDASYLAQSVAAKESDGEIHADVLQNNYQFALSCAWKNQQVLQNMGVSMEIPDNHGVTALDLCVSLLDKGDITMSNEFGVCRMVEAFMARRGLATTTAFPETPAPPSSVPRL